MKKMWQCLVLLCALTTGALVSARADGAARSVFTNVGQLAADVALPKVSQATLSLTGVVTFVSAGQNEFVLQDDSGAQNFLLGLPDASLIPGRQVHLSGQVSLGQGRAMLRERLRLDNDGLHGLIERSARQWFPAGRHPFVLDFFQAGREEGLEVQWRGPGFQRQPISAAALTHFNGSNVQTGLRAEVFASDLERLPDFSRLTPIRSFVATNFAVAQWHLGTNYALRFSGLLDFPVSGEYQFFLASDDGSRLTFTERLWQMEDLGAAQLPTPLTLIPGQRIARAENYRWAEVRGEVRFAGVGAKRAALELNSDAGRMWVEVLGVSGVWAELLPLAKVRIRGVTRADARQDETLLAHELLVPNTDQLVIEQLPLETWRRYPTNRLAQLPPLTMATGLVHLAGTVTAVAVGQSVTLADASGRLTLVSSTARADWIGQPLELLAAPQSSAGGSVWRAFAVKSSKDSDSDYRPIESIRTMSAKELDAGRRVKIRGVVISDWNSFSITVHDGDYGISCWFDLPVLTPSLGDWVEVEGVTRSGAFGPNLGSARLRVLGRAPLPSPLNPAWDRLVNGSLEQQWVEVEGVVQTLRGRSLTLEMVGGSLEVEVIHEDTSVLAGLRDAIVRVRGTVIPVYNSRRQLERVKLRVSSPWFFELVTPAGSDPFAAPLKSLAELTQFDSAGAKPFYRVKIRGQVIYADETDCHVMSGGSGLHFRSPPGVKLQPGDWLDVVGYPRLGRGAPHLHEPVVRVTQTGPLPPARAIGTEEFFGDTCESTRVQLDALLLNCSSGQGGMTFELQWGGRFLTARLASSEGATLDLPIGSRLRLTGTCAGRSGDFGAEVGAVHELLLNSTADVQVLARPPWWTMRRVLVVLGLLAAVLLVSLAWIYLLHRRVEARTVELDRAMRLRKEAELQHASEQERSRIARDLHDDLGASLTEISLLASLGQNPSLADSARDRFGEIAGKSRSLVNSLDAIVWAADPQEDDLESFADYLSGYARVFLESSGIVCRFKVPIELPPKKMDGRVRHDLLLAVKETLNNLVRHARATEVELGIHLHGSELAISIQDNGCGFDLATVPRGNGLANLRARLAKLGGDCELSSRPGQTKVTLKLHLKPIA